MAQPVLKYYTEPEYLALERDGLEKHGYYKGDIFAMSGASFKHNVIQVNVLVNIGVYLSGKKCCLFGSDLRIHIHKNSLFTYPDILIVCEEPKFADDTFDTLLNPAVIIEILSPSTANFDKGAKFDLYRDIASLEEYILIDSNTVHIVNYTKNADATWTLSERRDVVGCLYIACINLQIALSMVYQGV